MYDLSAKKVLITGVAGTIGAALARELAGGDRWQNVELVGIDNNESSLFTLARELAGKATCRFIYGDIRDRDTLMRESRGVDVILHTAALKHVSICEAAPYEAVKTNLIGVQNIIEVAFANNVERVLLTSSDKAVNPASNMGASKLLGEGLITAASRLAGASRPLFSCTRFGNVLGSNGSVIPIFRDQILSGKNITLTDRGMSRFIMSIQDAINLVLDSACMARGGEIFVTKMPIIRILDLATAMLQGLASHRADGVAISQIVETGIQPGEKLYEELMTDSEARRALELEKYFVLLPANQCRTADVQPNYPGIISTTVANNYNSELGPFMGIAALLAFLRHSDLLSGADH